MKITGIDTFVVDAGRRLRPLLLLDVVGSP